MDSYKEYNRLRKNLLQRARYHNIKLLNIPTAKHIAVNGKVPKKYVEKLARESERLKREAKSSIRIRVQTLREPHKKAILSRPSTSKISTPKSTTEQYDSGYYYNGEEVDYQTWANKTSERKVKLYKEHGSEFIATTMEGRLIDKYTGDDLGSALDTDSETLGNYLETHYWSDADNTLVPPSSHNIMPLSESVMFFSFIQQRIDIAFNDYLNRSNGGRKGASLDGIHQIQSALNSMKAEDIAKAVERYNAYSDEIKNYLDDALYYTSIQDDHYRALEIIMDLMLSPVEAASAKEIIANHSEELIYAEPGEEIEQMSESIYG